MNIDTATRSDLIHARTSYTTADGEERNGRFTDVWARRDRKWLAYRRL
jgi:hypothetical protein